MSRIPEVKETVPTLKPNASSRTPLLTQGHKRFDRFEFVRCEKTFVAKVAQSGTQNKPASLLAPPARVVPRHSPHELAYKTR